MAKRKLTSASKGGPSPAALKGLISSCEKGDRRAAAQLITLLETSDSNSSPAVSRSVGRWAFPAHTIGITGPPGAGKSTLLDYLIGIYRERGSKVGVLAVDPTSPFTGGALLGDRIRMSSHRGDPGVFIRSMGSRGESGGLAAAASDTLRVLAGAGFQIVFLETVGAGQAEVDVVNLADSVCVVQVPGLGDDIQLLKMGILEIADIFLVNKADRPGAKELKLQLEQALQESPSEVCRTLRQLGPDFSRSYVGPRWTPEVLLVSALERTGAPELAEALMRHRAFLQRPELSQAITSLRVYHEILNRATRRMGSELARKLTAGGKFERLVQDSAKGKMQIQDAVERITTTRGRITPGRV